MSAFPPRRGRHVQRAAAGTGRSFHVDAPAPDRRGLHDRRRRLAQGDEVIDELLEVRDITDVRGDEVAVLAGDAVALDDLRRLLRQLRDVLELPWRRPEADGRGQRQAERPRVDFRPARALERAQEQGALTVTLHELSLNPQLTVPTTQDAGTSPAS